MKCILSNNRWLHCRNEAVPGLIYCQRCFERSKHQSLAEKLEEQKDAGWIADIPLPGFENADAERAEVFATEQGAELSAEILKPKANIDAKAGAIEQNSPLFRGHGPQGELFCEGISNFAHSEHVHGSGNVNG